MDAVIRGDKEVLENYRNICALCRAGSSVLGPFHASLDSLRAVGADASGSVPHRSWQWGDLGMGAYEFEIR